MLASFTVRVFYYIAVSIMFRYDWPGVSAARPFWQDAVHRLTRQCWTNWHSYSTCKGISMLLSIGER